MFNEHLTFISDSSSQNVIIFIKDDTVAESSEMFFVSLSVNTALYPGVRLSPDIANVNIRYNDCKCVVKFHLALHVIMWVYD